MANTVFIARDPANQQLVCEVRDEDGDLVADYGAIVLKIGVNPGGTPASNPGHTMGKIILPRETQGCDEEGDPIYCMMLRSEWYSSPLTSNPTT